MLTVDVICYLETSIRHFFRWRENWMTTPCFRMFLKLFVVIIFYRCSLSRYVPIVNLENVESYYAFISVCIKHPLILTHFNLWIKLNKVFLFSYFTTINVNINVPKIFTIFLIPENTCIKILSKDITFMRGRLLIILFCFMYILSYLPPMGITSE